MTGLTVISLTLITLSDRASNTCLESHHTSYDGRGWFNALLTLHNPRGERATSARSSGSGSRVAPEPPLERVPDA